MEAPVCGEEMQETVRDASSALKSGRYPFGGFVNSNAIAQYRTKYLCGPCISSGVVESVSACALHSGLHHRAVRGQSAGVMYGPVPWIVGSRGCDEDGIQFLCECGRVHAFRVPRDDDTRTSRT